MDNIVKCFEKDAIAQKICKTLMTVGTLEDMERALILYRFGDNRGMSIDKIIDQPDIDGRPNEVLQGVYNMACQIWMNLKETEGRAYDFKSLIYTCIADVQKAVQIEYWKREKQVMSFDKDFLDELIETDSKTVIQGDVFDHLPYFTFYLDYSQNKELCNELGLDGILVKRTPVVWENKKRYLISALLYRDGNYFSVIDKLVNFGDQDVTVDGLLDRKVGFLANNDEGKNGISAETFEKYEKIQKLLLHSLLYLSTKEPDIREKTTSVAKRAAAKRNKVPKTELPEREYAVGVRIGNAFRKYIERQANGEKKKSEPTGRHNKPYVRRAHWHGHWVGSGEERRLELRWHHVTYCGLEGKEVKKELDTVKHKVKKDKKKKNSDGYPF